MNASNMGTVNAVSPWRSGQGSDELFSRAGDDTLYGGAGEDTFTFSFANGIDKSLGYTGFISIT